MGMRVAKRLVCLGFCLVFSIKLFASDRDSEYIAGLSSSDESVRWQSAVGLLNVEEINEARAAKALLRALKPDNLSKERAKTNLAIIRTLNLLAYKDPTFVNRLMTISTGHPLSSGFTDTETRELVRKSLKDIATRDPHLILFHARGKNYPKSLQALYFLAATGNQVPSLKKSLARVIKHTRLERITPSNIIFLYGTLKEQPTIPDLGNLLEHLVTRFKITSDRTEKNRLIEFAVALSDLWVKSEIKSATLGKKKNEMASLLQEILQAARTLEANPPKNKFLMHHTVIVPRMLAALSTIKTGKLRHTPTSAGRQARETFEMLNADKLPDKLEDMRRTALMLAGDLNDSNPEERKELLDELVKNYGKPILNELLEQSELFEFTKLLEDLRDLGCQKYFEG